MGIGKHTDQIAVNCWISLLEDFGLQKEFSSAREALLNGNLKDFRSLCVRDVGIVPPTRYKQIGQIVNLLKKYRFMDDAHTPDELECITNEKYIGNQIRLSTQRLNREQLTSFLVIQRARTICKRILGVPNTEEMHLLSKFGKKSSIGCPLSLAYIDHKLTDRRAFTGSAECSKWFFREILPKDAILNRLVEAIGLKPGDSNLELKVLSLVNVPKKWNVHRSITPLQLIDLFYTYGVGRAVQRRLKEAGLDIRYLQDTHRRVISRFSETMTHATADLSAASDSITSDLLNRLLPRPWYKLVKLALTHQINVGGNQCYTESVLPMGNGMTFPLETLVFYSLTKAIGDLTGVKGMYSVFGDDLIYPRRIHKYVCSIFPDMGITLNGDKTFVSFPFRESCGEDFYRGFPVRSFYLSNSDSFVLSGKRLESHLYSIINGLRRRWDEHAISGTIEYLLLELSNITEGILRVPPLFPDTSGIKVESPNDHLLDMKWASYEPVRIYFADGSRWYQFKYLKPVPKKRFIKQQEPYYWQRLSGDTDVLEDQWSLKRKFTIFSEVPTSPIQWRKVQRTKWTKDSKARKRKVKYKIQIPFVSSRVVEQYMLQTNRERSVSDWNLKVVQGQGLNNPRLRIALAYLEHCIQFSEYMARKSERLAHKHVSPVGMPR
jgi:hypothetical protein